MGNNAILATGDLKKYLSGVFETELAVFVQEQTLLRLQNTYNGLALPRRIAEPQKKKEKTSIPDYMLLIGFGSGIVFGIIMGIVEYVISGGGFWQFLGAVIMAIIFAFVGVIVGGLVIGGIVGYVVLQRERQKLELLYEEDMRNYRARVKNDGIRIKEEQRQKKRLLVEIEDMKRQIEVSKQNLASMYSFGVLNPDYQNIYAVSSIYGYLQKGRTHCLIFNSATGDQGAYNIYEAEMRMNIIIRNTQQILDRLDEIAAHQYELVEGLRRANGQIATLCGSVNKHMKSVSGTLENIERCEGIIAYNTEQTNNQLEFMTWLRLSGIA